MRFRLPEAGVAAAAVEDDEVPVAAAVAAAAFAATGVADVIACAEMVGGALVVYTTWPFSFVVYIVWACEPERGNRKT